eukprot:COSAG02_NODE_135_length_34565_cov_80.368856_16_plen_85_part_00
MYRCTPLAGAETHDRQRAVALRGIGSRYEGCALAGRLAEKLLCCSLSGRPRTSRCAALALVLPTRSISWTLQSQTSSSTAGGGD